MKDTNEIQKQIEKKAKDELYGMIDEFIDKLKRYKHDSWKDIEIHHAHDRVTKLSLGDKPYSEAKSILKSIVNEAYLEELTKKKTTELLTKLELI